MRPSASISRIRRFARPAASSPAPAMPRRRKSANSLGLGPAGLAVVKAVADRLLVLDGKAQAGHEPDGAGGEHELDLAGAPAGVEPRARRHLGLHDVLVVERHELQRHGSAAFIAHDEVSLGDGPHQAAFHVGARRVLGRRTSGEHEQEERKQEARHYFFARKKVVSTKRRPRVTGSARCSTEQEKTAAAPAGGRPSPPAYSGKTSSPPSKSSLRLSDTANALSAVGGAPLSRWPPHHS